MVEIDKLDEKFEKKISELKEEIQKTNLKLERNTAITEENIKAMSKFTQENTRVMEKFSDTLQSVQLAMEKIVCSNRNTEGQIVRIEENMKEVRTRIDEVDNKTKIDVAATATSGITEGIKKYIISAITGGSVVAIVNYLMQLNK